LLNGLLVLAYFVADHLLVCLLLPALVWLGATAPTEQRSAHALAATLALVSTAFTPAPVPLLLLLMTVFGMLACRYEQFSPAGLHWFVVRGLILYGLFGLGFLAYQAYLASTPAGGESLLDRGQTYLNVLVGVAAYVFPLGFLVYLLQKTLLHPPLPASPTDTITAIRTRGRR
jgi:hypothetical protein